jgi:hypothetical protein
MWLCAPAKPSSAEALLDIAGSWKDDPHLHELIDRVYKLRGRPIGESE